MKGGQCFTCLAVGWLLVFEPTPTACASPFVLNTNLQIRLLLSTSDGTGSRAIRIAKDPRNNRLYYLKFNGDIFEVALEPGPGTSTPTKVYGAADHGISDSAQGMVIGPDGAIYVVGNFTTNDGNRTVARIVRGMPEGGSGRTWSLLAQTEPYPRSQTAFDHVFNGIIVTADGESILVNSGSRTDHGEIQDAGGLFPNIRELPLTAKIFRLPAGATNLLLPNDANALQAGGYVFAEGTRNTFDLAIAPDGALFGTENGPDRDMSDELNWLRPNLHFGFPWRMGGADNPQQFPAYDPGNDPLLDPRFRGVNRGYYHNDPTFPPSPASFAEPVINMGPDADKFRDPADGLIKDAADLGLTLSTFTAHRSPLGLVFDTLGAMDLPFRNNGFMLSFTPGDPNGTNVPGPFADASQDLVMLELIKLGETNHQAWVTKLIGGFSAPIDAEIIGNRIYVIEYGGDEGLWEITFPPMRARMTAPRFQNGVFQFTLTGLITGLNYHIQASSNLVNWMATSNIVATGDHFKYGDAAAGTESRRFYRVLQP